MSEENIDKEKKTIQEIIQTGAEMAGGLSGLVIGSIVTGGAGAIIAAVSGPIITKLFAKAGNEIKARVFGNREEKRIGLTYAIGWQKMKTRLENGDELRNDDFFQSDSSNRSSADEILEGVLRNAQSEYEEKKLPFYGNLLANLGFDSTISKHKANLFLKIAQRMTYKQLCILQYVCQKKTIRTAWFHHFQHLEKLYEYADLESLVEELINFKVISVVRASGNVIRMIGEINLGTELANIMQLNEIEEADIKSIEEEFETVKQIILAEENNYS